MTKRYALNWSIWIGIVSGVYALLYTLSPLYKYGCMPCTFVALPLYFISGAKRSEFFDFLSSACMGVVWGLIYIWSIGMTMNAWRLNEAFANGLNILFWTVILCAFHFIVNANTPIFSKVPMMFGGLASTFMLGAENWWVIMITLCFGVLLAYLCQCGTLLLDSSGRWNLAAQEKVSS
jgi:hypothetical protein